jgi:hypothetical protein
MARLVSALPSGCMDFLAWVEEARFAHMWQMKYVQLEAAIVQQMHVFVHLEVVCSIGVEVGLYLERHAEEDVRRDMEIARMENADAHNLEGQDSMRNGPAALRVLDLVAIPEEGRSALVPLDSLVEDMDTQRQTSVEVAVREDEASHS